MSNFGEFLLKLLTLGLYGRGKVSKDVKRYRKDGKLRVEKSIDRDGVGVVGNSEFVESLNSVEYENED